MVWWMDSSELETWTFKNSELPSLPDSDLMVLSLNLKSISVASTMIKILILGLPLYNLENRSSYGHQSDTQ